MPGDWSHNSIASLEAGAFAIEGRYGKFSTAQNAQYSKLEEVFQTLPALLWGWALGPVVLAFLSWIFQRLLYRKLVQGWEDTNARNRAFEKTDGLAAFGLDPGSDSRVRLRQLRHHFGPVYAHFSAPPHPTRAVGRVLLGAHAYLMLIGACNPML